MATDPGDDCFKILTEKDDDYSESILSCMEGPKEGANYKPSSDGPCAECGRKIHWATTAPKGIKKVCRACTLRMMKERGDEVPQMALTETTIKETFAKLNIKDTPENRRKALAMSRSGYMRWLREGLDVVKSSAWDR